MGWARAWRTVVFALTVTEPDSEGVYVGGGVAPPSPH